MTVTAMDWHRFAASYWNREPAVVPCPLPVPLQRAYDVIVAASEPFRGGTRFFTLPDVRFFVTGGRLRAPGGLLPGAAEATVDDYLNSLEVRCAGDGYLLAVEQPLMLDFGLWSSVRDLVTGLWREVGWPNLPVVAELSVGSKFTRSDCLTSPSQHAIMVWVLEGSLSVRLWPESSGPVPATTVGPDHDMPGVLTLDGDAGHLLYVPSAYRYAFVYGKRCVALCLRVPVDGRLAIDAVRDVVADIMQSRRGSGDAVPFLGPPVPGLLEEPGWDNAGDVPVQLAAIGDEIQRALDCPELARMLRIKWAARRSAGALEPVPPPRSGDAFGAEQRIRLAGEVVRLPDGPNRWIWAVNGHVFQVQGVGGERILADLRERHGVEMSRLCSTADGEYSQGALTLLRRLYSLRGVEMAPDGR
jgi:hypothetical protein